MDSIFLCGDPNNKNFSIPSKSIPASSSITIDPLVRMVINTCVASSSKAFSTNSLTISYGETHVFVANSLKNDG
jgi:hypothetical protein